MEDTLKLNSEERTTIQTYNGLAEISIKASLTGKRIIFLDGPIDDDAVQTFAMQVLHLTTEDPCKPIKLIISSEGGVIDSGMSLYDILQTSPAPIKTYCLGKAYSMGAVIFCSGRNGRYLLPHAKLLIHEPLILSNIAGRTSTVKSMSESLLKMKADIDGLLAKHTGQPIEKIAELTKTDHFLTADEAVENGFADKIIDFSEIIND